MEIYLYNPMKNSEADMAKIRQDKNYGLIK